MGAFNEWVKGSPLADPAERRVVAVALNILEGATLADVAPQLLTLALMSGVFLVVGASIFRWRPS